MITFELATELRDAGLGWVPASGDRFMVPDRDLDDQVFVISEMTIEPQQLVTGGIVRFNGTTEWALDSIEQTEVVWLPHEAQLRTLLGDAFLRLEAVPDGFVVVLREDGYGGHGGRHLDIDAERAYARALLTVLRRNGNR
ncbi:MAG TPA: pilus assembly protein CpaE [Nocardioidaceae bacterium]|nr:pilus assembly protein CpaE [Nocardioidaceae bacterium]